MQKLQELQLYPGMFIWPELDNGGLGHNFTLTPMGRTCTSLLICYTLISFLVIFHKSRQPWLLEQFRWSLETRYSRIPPINESGIGDQWYMWVGSSHKWSSILSSESHHCYRYIYPEADISVSLVKHITHYLKMPV